MNMWKGSSSFPKPGARKASSQDDPHGDSSYLLPSGSPRSSRRVSFSIPEGSAIHGPSGGPGSSNKTFTESPTSHSPKTTINHNAPYSKTFDSTLSLKSQLQECRLPSVYGISDNKKFLPRSAVDDLIHKKSVEEYWQGHQNLQPLSRVLEYVFGERNARFVFVIVVLMEEPSLLGDLMRDEVYDDDLPLSDIEVEGENPQFGINLSANGPSVPLPCFKKWSVSHVNYFGQLQRQVNAVVLENWSIKLPVTEIPRQSVLPFMESEGIHDGNSKVFRVKVHHSHHKFRDTAKPATDRENAPFALKVLEATDELTFNLEVKALMKIRRNQHLVTAVTAFKYQEKYHLLFNWADGGTLADFWKSNSPSLTHDSVCWLAQQCHGLADGLYGIHNAKISVQELADVAPLQEPIQVEEDSEPEDQDRIHGRHGDIKPDNILWFSDEKNQYDRGVLKITDFGVTAFHNAKTTKVPAKRVPRTMTYAAPEIEVSQEDDEPLVSRPFDIWSLGCVYLEFITWFLLGNEGLDQFQKHRMEEKVTRRKFQEDSFYSIHRRGRLNPWSRDFGTVKTNVTSWIKELRQHENCTPFLREFLDYIQKRMLVDKSKRELSGIVCTQLRRMLDNCQQDPQYAGFQGSMRTEVHHGDALQPVESRWQKVARFCCG